MINKILEESIEKWEAIVAGNGGDNGIENCSLCKEFWENGCIGCPVFEKTGEYGCAGSPYDEWEDHHEYVHDHDPFPNDTKVMCARCIEIAEKELEFLKSLRDD
jgi:hypothetical protein